MRILFVSSTTTGGSGLSQRELARSLWQRGHEVVILADPKTSSRARRLYRRQVNLTTKLDRSRFRAARPPLLLLQRPIGRRIRRDRSFDVPVFMTEVPENGYHTIRRSFAPEVIVGSSIDRVTWRRLRTLARRAGIPTVLYIREPEALGHLTITKAPPDLLLANAESLAVAARATGHACTMIPSAIDLHACEVESTRERALLINPIESRGGDRVWDLAERNPDIDFVLQESWSLDDDDVDRLTTLVQSHPNVEMRRRTTDTAEIYRDARVLLVPHRVENRPRVIAEAQHNGIPVLVTAQPGLVEAAGPGGVVLSADFDASDWSAELRRLWDDDAAYATAVTRAREHAGRPENDIDLVADRFEAAVGELVHPAAPERTRPEVAPVDQR